MAGLLSIVATPIGNLGDMTERARSVLAQADAVLAEDTRVTGRLLAACGIQARLERCDENVIAKRAAGLVERMLAGQRLAFCSDAGMPGISDPGLVLVDAARDAGIAVEVLPGASALTAAVAAAGFPCSAVYFGGFLPRKQHARRELLNSLAALDAALVFFESPHRAASSAADIAAVLPSRRVALCRELTKLHEEVLRLPAGELAEQLAAREGLKGELVLVVEPPHAQQEGTPVDEAALAQRIDEGLAAGTPASALAKELAAEFGLPRNAAYEAVLAARNPEER